MAEDIDEMEKMLNDYLQYAKAQGEEKSVKINLNNLIDSILKNYSPIGILLHQKEIVEIDRRINLVRRCISNVIVNGLTYGDKIFIDIKKTMNNGIIIVEDDGPGIQKMNMQMFLNLFIELIKVEV